MVLTLWRNPDLSRKLTKTTNNMIYDQGYIRNLYSSVLGREPSPGESESILESLGSNALSLQQLAFQTIFSAEFLQRCLENAIDVHLSCIHFARSKMVSLLLPSAKAIVDLGGANGSIFDMGYPYKFDRIWVIDLPPEDRCELYQHLALSERITPNGPISVLHRSMTDLEDFDDNSIDLVWSGQSIEHISEPEALLVYEEARRVLRPDGWFCLDTPNRLLTEIHTEGFIHPEHKIEYYPDHLKRSLTESGFLIAEQRGICEMPNSFKTKKLDYRDFILGNWLSDNIDSSYIQYYRCKKR